MKTHVLLLAILLPLASVSLLSCKKVKELNQDPEIEPLRHGFKTSAAIGYSASLAYTFFMGEELPGNVIIHTQPNSETKTGILLVKINDEYPLPFNTSVGQITILGIWGEDGGVITALFTDIDILEAKYKFSGIHTIPVIGLENGKIMTLFAEQDILIGEGSDTLYHINMTNTQISLEMKRLKADLPDEVTAAVQQNVWFTTIDQNNSMADSYDDEYSVSGGGQIVEITSDNGGMLYHAMIGAKYIQSTCDLNPITGVGFIQNFKFGTKVDLGHIFLNFHEDCDGKAFVEFATGKYITSNKRNVNLNFN
jgi:hypothetical protein